MSSSAWKNTMATDHTEGEPPKRGSTILVNIGCTANSRAAERKIAAPKAGNSSAGAAGTLASARDVMHGPSWGLLDPEGMHEPCHRYSMRILRITEPMMLE